MRTQSLRFPLRLRLLTVVLLALALVMMGTMGANAQGRNGDEHGFYQQTNLVSDIPGLAQSTDPTLVNPWGIVAGPTSPFWISDNGTGKSELFNGQGQAFPVGTPLVVTVPAPAKAPMGTVAAPSGIVFNGNSEFNVTENGVTGASLFIFTTEDGTISGWSPSVDLHNAILAVDNSASAIYKGLALGSNESGDFLFAANFHAGTVDVFDKNFKQVHMPFKDRSIPRGYAPFDIVNIHGFLYVSYAKQDKAGTNDVPGEGHGFIDIFNTDGQLLSHLVSRGELDSPWGMVLAPAGFGQFSGDLLVGNFGDGHINVYNPLTGRHLGELRGKNNRPIVINKLWGLTFGNGTTSGPTTTLYFTAGIDDEMHGLFGMIVNMG